MEVLIHKNFKKVVNRYFWHKFLSQYIILSILLVMIISLILFYLNKPIVDIFVSIILFYFVFLLSQGPIVYVFKNFVIKNIVVKVEIAEDILYFSKSSGKEVKLNENNVSYVCFPFDECKKFHYKGVCYLFNFNNNYFLFFPDAFDRNVSSEIVENYFKKRINRKFNF